MRITTAAFQCLIFHSTVSNINALVDTPNKTGSISQNEFVDVNLKAVQDTNFEQSESLPALDGIAGLALDSFNNPFGLAETPTGSSNEITIDTRSGVVSSIHMSKPILPGDGKGNNLLWSIGAIPEADNAHGSPKQHEDWMKLGEEGVKQWLAENQSILGINSKDELFGAGRTRLAVHDDGDMIQLHIQRTYHDIPVIGSRATATIQSGNLVNVGFEQWGKIPKEFSVVPRISAAEAVVALAAHAGQSVVTGQELCKPELQILTLAKGIVPPPAKSKLSSTKTNLFGTRGGKKSKGNASYGDGYSYSLVWKICPTFEGQQQEIMEGFVDANTSQVYSFIDKVDYLSAKGAVYPTSNDGKSPDGQLQDGWPMAFMSVGNEITDTGGNYYVGGSRTATFYGPYVNMVDNCGSDSLTQVDGINWGGSSGNTDCTTPGIGGNGNTHSSRTGFYELNKMMEIARSRLPSNNWLQGRLTANMNIANTCNAYWNGSINFYRSGGGCGNTGEIAAIFDHEWGHGMDANDVNGGIASPSGEGIADLYSALRLGDSCIGRGFFVDGSKCSTGGNNCKTCTGVRDIDYANKNANSPFTYSNSNAKCGGGVHCVGQVYSEAVWDLYKRHLQAAPYNYDDNTALEIVTRLTYIAAGNIATWFGGSVPWGGCGNNSGYRSFLLADDDDTNLNNGTPHMTAIYNAFNSHEIACNTTPTVQDSGCIGNPVTAPTVTVLAGNMGATLNWNSVGAAKYQVLRTEGVFGCAQGKVLLGETSGTTWTDVGLMNNRQYYYIVVPKGSKAACYGPSSDCKTVMPVEGPDFGLSCASEPIFFDENQTPASDSRQCTLDLYFGFVGTITLGCSPIDLSGVTCASPPQSVTITQGETQVTVTFNIQATTSAVKSEGAISIVASSLNISKSSSISVSIVGGGGAQVAIYDVGRTPRCRMYGVECSSDTLLNGRGNVGPEPNYPNTLDTCVDGNSGVYHDDESLDKIVVKSASGVNMAEKSQARITATVWAWGTGSNDFADFFYANDANNPVWTYIGTVSPSGGGVRDLSVTYTLPQGLNQAVRVNFRYNGSPSSCTGGSWADTDDLVFTVLPDGTPAPTKSPTFQPTGPTNSPTKFPTMAPTPLPTTSPTQAPTTAKPTASPTLKPTSSPTAQPTSQPTTSCVARNFLCPSNASLCCSKTCRKGKCT